MFDARSLEGKPASAVLWSAHLYNMRTLSALILGSELLLAGAAFGQMGMEIPDWQSVKIVHTSDPVFPLPLSKMGITRGEARVVINTDADGKLIEWLVVGYSYPEFAREAVAAIKQWTYIPARLRGEPVGTTIEVFFDFEAKGVVVSTTGIDALEVQWVTVFGANHIGYRPCSLRELDRIPTPLSAIAPRYSVDLARKGVTGKVTVDFYIDETGIVRVPSVSPRENSDLTAWSIEALRHWKFEPPTRNGKPVLVRASQVFNFSPGK
jgi:TonB family protein